MVAMEVPRGSPSKPREVAVVARAVLVLLAPPPLVAMGVHREQTIMQTGQQAVRVSGSGLAAAAAVVATGPRSQAVLAVRAVETVVLVLLGVLRPPTRAAAAVGQGIGVPHHQIYMMVAMAVAGL
tara:strand:+ start:11357 stop:11731 length:375 start_codon:yes stop_codon:yes gene_type:complete